jgi:hypothetical protein
VPYLSLSVASASTLKFNFSSRIIHTEFVVDKVALRQFLRRRSPFTKSVILERFTRPYNGKLFTGGPCKRRAEGLLKLSRHQLKMAVVILTGTLL